MVILVYKTEFLNGQERFEFCSKPGSKGCLSGGAKTIKDLIRMLALELDKKVQRREDQNPIFEFAYQDAACLCCGPWRRIAIRKPLEQEECLEFWKALASLYAACA